MHFPHSPLWLHTPVNVRRSSWSLLRDSDESSCKVPSKLTILSWGIAKNGVLLATPLPNNR